MGKDKGLQEISRFNQDSAEAYRKKLVEDAVNRFTNGRLRTAAVARLCSEKKTHDEGAAIQPLLNEIKENVIGEHKIHVGVQTDIVASDWSSENILKNTALRTSPDPERCEAGTQTDRKISIVEAATGPYHLIDNDAEAKASDVVNAVNIIKNQYDQQMKEALLEFRKRIDTIKAEHAKELQLTQERHAEQLKLMCDEAKSFEQRMCEIGRSGQVPMNQE